MKKRLFGFAIVGLLVAGATVCSAAKYEQLNVGELSLDGTKVTATAAQLNTLGPLSSLVLTNVTKSTGAVTATAVVTPQAPSAVTPTITVTAQRPGAQTPTITVTIQATTIYDATGAACTNAAGEVVGVVTGATAVCSALLDYPTNATAACSELPLFATNATAAITVVGGDAVVTNITVQR